MGSRVLVIGRDALRRGTIFAVVFGGAIGVAAWFAGGLKPKNSAAIDDADLQAPLAPPPPATAKVGDTLSAGPSSDVVIVHDDDKVLGGKPVRWRSWTMAWKEAVPKQSPDPDVGVQDLTLPHLVLYPEPERADAPPVVEGAPGTTRVTALRGVVSYQKEVRTQARLEGDVRLDGNDPQRGDLRLRTKTLDVTMTGGTHGAAEKRHAQTADFVEMDGGRLHMQGTGLDADLSGSDVRATLLADVKGRFDAATSLTGGPTSAAATPTDVACAGACEIVSLDKGRGADRRWRAAFHDKVHVTQGESVLDCDLLEVEFRAGDRTSKTAPPPERVVATGNVRMKGRTETRTFDVVAAKASHWQEGAVGRERDVVVFEGAPIMNVYGPLGSAKSSTGKEEKKPEAPKQPGDSRERLEIRCKESATMTTVRAGNLVTSPYRANVVFEKDVVAKQWADEKVADATSELRAPKATLFGTRWPNGAFQPDTMTAEGGVDVKRQEFVSRSQSATWEKLPGFGIDRYILDGEPKVDCLNVDSLPLFGKPKKTTNSHATLTAANDVRFDVYEERPPEAGKPPRPYATVSAAPRAVLTQIVDGVDTARVTAQQIDATVAPGPQLQHAEATGGAHVWGLGDQGDSRDVYGSKIVLDELVLPPGAPKSAPHSAQVAAIGENTSPAVATIREKDGRFHDVRADVLRYDQDGSVVTASRGVVATLEVADPGKGGASKAVEGPVKITAQDMRVDLAKPGEEAKQQLKKITATGTVFIDGKLSRVEGRDAVFDATTGIAEAHGAPARVVYLGESARYTSFVAAELIRAYFDVAPGAKKQGDLLRATCPNGGAIIRYFDPPGPDGNPVAQKPPRRMQINSAGPIDSTRTEATAVNDVRCDMWSLEPSGEWTKPEGTVYCERAHMTFDVNAPGQVKDRIRTLDATGAENRQVVVDVPNQFHGRADRVQVDFATNKMRLSTTGGADCYVRETATGRQFFCDGGLFDYVSHEWSEVLNQRELEPTVQPPAPVAPAPPPRAPRK